MVVENSDNKMYKRLLTDASATNAYTGLPLGFTGTWRDEVVYIIEVN